jgi:hypothetical protein
MKLLGITSVNFDIIGQRLVRLSVSSKILEKSGSIMVHQLFIDSKKAYDSLGGKYYTAFLLSLEYRGN